MRLGSEVVNTPMVSPSWMWMWSGICPMWYVLYAGCKVMDRIDVG